MAIVKYIARRLLVLIPVLLGISLAAFLLAGYRPRRPGGRHAVPYRH